MKESIWGILIVSLGLLGILIVQSFQSVTVTNDQTYYLLKETTEAAMLDAVDLTHYRKTGEIRIVEDKFVENLTRRFAESANANQDYAIVVHDVVETPPFVSVGIGTFVFSLRGDRFEIANSIDSIIESKYSQEEYKELKDKSLELTCLPGECEITSCIDGDIRFTGWGEVFLPQAVCQQGATLEKEDRDANYQVCDNGKWINHTEQVSSVIIGNSTYVWNFKKNSDLHNIDVTTSEKVDFGKCIESFTICPSEGITLYVGESSRLTPTYTPEDAVNKELEWTSSNSSTVVVGNIEAIVTGNKTGNSVITAISSNNKKATCNVRVIDLECPTSPITMDPNSTAQATLVNGIVPSDAIWSVDNDNYAIIDSNGMIKSKDMYGTYYYNVEINGKKLQCPFIIKNTQQKELIVTCNKEEMNIYEQVECTVKSSEVGETLTGVDLSCTNNTKKLTPILKDNNFIICSPTSTGELNVNATKSGYTPGNKTILVSKIGEESFGIECKKGATDNTPLSTGINFNTDITCSVIGDKKADLKFEYKSYTGSSLGTKEAKNKTSIKFTTGSTKGILILTAKKGKQKITKYFEVGCVPGTIVDYFNTKGASMPDLCPQHFEYRLTEEGYIELYTQTVPTIYNRAELCGVHGYTDPSKTTNYSIDGYSDDLKESKNYRSYFDEQIKYNWSLSLETPTILFDENKYSFYKAKTYNYDERIEYTSNVTWSSRVHDYVGTAVLSKSHTFKGDFLSETNPYCVQLAKDHPLDPNAPTMPRVVLSIVSGESYIIPEQTPEYGYFVKAELYPATAFSGEGKWMSLTNTLDVKQDKWSWKSGRVLPTGKPGSKGTAHFTAFLTEEAKAKYKVPYVSASVDFTILKNCDELYLEIENENVQMKYKEEDTSYYENIILSSVDIALNEKSGGNTGKWKIINGIINDRLRPGEDKIVSKQTLLIGSSPHINDIKIKYVRTLDKNCIKYINIKPLIDNVLPTIEVKYKGNIVEDNIYIKVGSSFSMSDLVATATDNNPNFGIQPLKPVEEVDINTNFPDDFEIEYVTQDLSGNRASKKITVIVTDEEIKPPKCVVTSSTSNWTNSNVTVTGTCVAQGGAICNDKISYTYTSNTDTNTAGPGVNGGAGQVCDTAGNCATCEATATVKIDKTSPSCIVSGGTPTWTNQNVTIKGTCSDTGGSGCYGNVVSNTFTDNFRDTVESPGTVRDVAGNTTVCGSLMVKIDKIPPRCSSSGGSISWTNQAVVLTGKCTDTGSGCVGNTTRSYIQTTELYNQSPGLVYDNAGNSANCPANQTVKIDRIPPKCLTSANYTDSGNKYPGIWTNRSVTIKGTCSDTGGSGCSNNVPSKTYSSDINSSESPGTVYDNAGNSASCSAISVKIDKTAPSCRTSSKYTSSGIRYYGSWTDQSITLTGVCSSDNVGGSGCNENRSASKIINYNTNSNESPGAVYDNAGNAKICAANLIVRIDKSNPRVSVGNCTTTLLSNSRYLSAVVSNYGPSTISYQWYYNGSMVSTGSTYNATKSGSYTVKICNELNKCDSASCYLRFRRDTQ